MTTADPIVEALRGQVDCYRRLTKLAAQQHEHVQQGRTEQLLEVLGQRQELLDRLTGLERVVAPAKKQWAQYATTLADGPRGEAEALLAETRRLLAEITAVDSNDMLVLQQRKLNLGRQISQAASARQVNRNYAAAAAYGKRPPAVDMQQ